MIRDRDRIYGAVVRRRLRAMSIRDRPTAPASPWQNGFAERLIGSIRRECLDHIIVLGEAHLRRILKFHADYYNGVRTHRSLNKDTPINRPIQRTGVITSTALLGGLHYRYSRVQGFRHTQVWGPGRWHRGVPSGSLTVSPLRDDGEYGAGDGRRPAVAACRPPPAVPPGAPARSTFTMDNGIPSFERGNLPFPLDPPGSSANDAAGGKS